MSKKKAVKREEVESTDIQKLFSSTEVEGYKIGKFSLGDIEKLTPWFDKFALHQKNNNKELSFEAFDVSSLLQNLDMLPLIIEGLSIYFDEDIKIVKAFEIDVAQRMVILLVSKNIEYLKNSFALVKGLIQKLTEITN